MKAVAKETVGPYEVLDTLGGNSLLSIHEAQDQRSGRRVLLKRLRGDLMQAEEPVQASRETARLVQGLQHPAILPVVEVGGEGKQLWVAYERPEGTIFKEALARGIELGIALRAIAQAAQALDFAHRNSVTHGDVRPSSLYIRPNGTALLADFGMAALARGAHPLVGVSLMMPLPSYLPPESAQAPPDARGDIYSLGMLLYETVTGVVPFPAYNPETAWSKQRDFRIEPPSALNPYLPHEMDVVALHALTPKPEDRYASGAEFGEAVLALADRLPEETARLRVPPTARREATTRIEDLMPTAAPLGEEGYRICPICEATNGQNATYCHQCWTSLTRMPVISAEAARKVERRLRRRAAIRRLGLRLGVPGSILLVLVVLALDISPPPGLGLAPPVSLASSVAGPEEWVSPRNGAASTGSTLSDYPLPKGTVKWQFPTSAPFASSPIVAEGKVVVTTADKRIVALDPGTGGVLWEQQATGPLDVSPVYADGLVYVVYRDTTLLALKPETGETVWQARVSNPFFGWVGVADGVVYSMAKDGMLETFDAKTGEPRWQTKLSRGFTASPSAAAGRIVVPTDDRLLYVLDSQDGAIRLLYLTRLNPETAPALAYGHAYFGANDGRVYAIELHARHLPLEKGVLRWWGQLFLWGMAPFPPGQSGTAWVFQGGRGSSGAFKGSPAVAQDRVFAVSQGGTVYALSATTGKELWRVPLKSATFASPIVVNETLYVGSESGLSALDAKTGQVLWRFEADGPITSAPAYSKGVLYVTTQGGSLYALE